MTKRIPSPLKRRLRKRLGAEGVRTALADLFANSFDATAVPAMPDVVVTPRTVDDLIWVLTTLWDEGVTVTLRGAGTGFSGGAVPVRGGAVVVCDRLRKITKEPGERVTVEPGVIVDDLNRFLETWALFYAVDPASAEVSTLGGNVAENAGGPRALKYGVTRDYVERLEVYSPARGREVYENVPGRVDMLSALIGSEGTLAATLSATLRVLPVPEAGAAVLAVFRDAVSAGRASVAVLNGGGTPAKLEFLDRRCVGCLNKREPGILPDDAGAVLLLEYDGSKEGVNEQVADAEVALRRSDVLRLEIGRDRGSVERLTRARRGISPALGQLAPHKKNEDICVPRSRTPEVLEYVRELEARYDTAIPTFGHIGDGNLHVNFMYDARDAAWRARVEEAVELLLRRVIASGGTITGEHGVGSAKKAYLPLEQSEAEYKMAKAVKAYFDPRGLLNPGKIWD